MLKMIVKGIGLDSNSGQPVLVLTDLNKSRALPILIGAAEASSISQGLSRKQVERPLTHDLILNTIEALGYEVKRVDLVDERDGAYIACIVLSLTQEEPLEGDAEEFLAEEVVIDARPSDAIALAVRDDVPIYVHEGLILNGSIAIDVERDQAEKDEFSKFVAELKPSDFRMPDKENQA